MRGLMRTLFLLFAADAIVSLPLAADAHDARPDGDLVSVPRAAHDARADGRHCLSSRGT